jgi:histidyl-tRNA synthetase
MASNDEKTVKGKKSLETLRGFRDVLPEEAPAWEWVEDLLKGFGRAYGFGRLRLPVLESTTLFERGVGKETDIVDKEMFTFLDPGGSKVTLRPEATASTVRAYIEHGMLNQPQPVKMWSFEPFFRHERPQAGRYRQFWQANFDAIGSNDPVLDAQMVIIAERFFSSIGVDVTVQINSLGTPASRKAYLADLVKYYKGAKKKLSETDARRLAKNPLRLLDSKEPGMAELAAEAPQLVEYLDEESKAHFTQVLEYLDDAEVPYVLNPHLVRGLDYYTNTVFEVQMTNPKGEDVKGLTLAGGGRYNGLVQLLGGRDATPAVGMAIGIERAILALRDAGVAPKNERKVDVFFCQLGDAARRRGLKIFEQFRFAKVDVAEAFSKSNLKGQLELADRFKAPFAVILGQKEVLDGTIILRDMESGAQEIVDSSKIVQIVEKRLAESRARAASAKEDAE